MSDVHLSVDPENTTTTRFQNFKAALTQTHTETVQT